MLTEFKGRDQGSLFAGKVVLASVYGEQIWVLGDKIGNELGYLYLGGVGGFAVQGFLARGVP